MLPSSTMFMVDSLPFCTGWSRRRIPDRGPGQSGVNFTNILRAAFSYKSFWRSFYVLTIWVCNFWRKDFFAKTAHKNVGEIDTRTVRNLATASYRWLTPPAWQLPALPSSNFRPTLRSAVQRLPLFCKLIMCQIRNFYGVIASFYCFLDNKNIIQTLKLQHF